MPVALMLRNRFITQGEKKKNPTKNQKQTSPNQSLNATCTSKGLKKLENFRITAVFVSSIMTQLS